MWTGPGFAGAVPEDPGGPPPPSPPKDGKCWLRKSGFVRPPLLPDLHLGMAPFEATLRPVDMASFEAAPKLGYSLAPSAMSRKKLHLALAKVCTAGDLRLTCPMQNTCCN